MFEVDSVGEKNQYQSHTHTHSIEDAGNKARPVLEGTIDVALQYCELKIQRNICETLWL